LLDGVREVRFPARGDCCIVGFSSLLRGTRPLFLAWSSCQRRRGQSGSFANSVVRGVMLGTGRRPLADGLR